LRLSAQQAAVGLDEAFGTHDAGDRRVLGEFLLLHEQLQRAQTAAARLYAVEAGFLAGLVQDGTGAEALQKPAPGDIGGKVLDRNAGLDLADIAVVDDELVEGDGVGGGERNLRADQGVCSKRDVLGRPEDSLFRPCPSPFPLSPLTLRASGKWLWHLALGATGARHLFSACGLEKSSHLCRFASRHSSVLILSQSRVWPDL